MCWLHAVRTVIRASIMIRRLSSAILILCGALLLVAPLFGLLRPADFRPYFAEETLPYASALALMDTAFAEEGASRQFLEHSVAIYDAATVYEWPQELTRVSFRDNWILWAAAWTDPLMRRAGLTDLDDLFSVYESVSYERALGRGFGICSQNALGLADLLGRRYGMEAHMIGLDGHVVAEAAMPTGERYLLDPSVGVFLPFSLDQAAEETALLRTRYAEKGRADIVEKYAAAGNVRLPEPGSRPFRPKLYLIERASDVLKWGIPILVIAAGLLLWPRRKTATTYRPGAIRR
jgi:hypothetical protein